MTKLYISADLEGVCGVVSPRHCDPKAGDLQAYHWAVKQLAHELNLVVTATEAYPEDDGAHEITINDAHMAMTNLCQSDLPASVRLISGKPKTCAMAAELNSSYDAMLLVGYHTMAGTQGGVLCHTFHDQLFEVSLNGTAYGEGGINALYASLVHNVPVIFASGDNLFCQEMHQLLPGLTTVETKTAISFSCASNHPPQVVEKAYEETIRSLMQQQNTWKQNILNIQAPYRLQITFTTTRAADVVATLPWVSRVDGRTLSFTSDDFGLIYEALQSCYSLLAYQAVI